MSGLSVALDDYLAMRRSLRYKLERAGELLADFVAHLTAAGTEYVTVELAVDWAMLTAHPDSCWRPCRTWQPSWS
jgi:integrase/recombinase XerD